MGPLRVTVLQPFIILLRDQRAYPQPGRVPGASAWGRGRVGTPGMGSRDGHHHGPGLRGGGSGSGEGTIARLRSPWGLHRWVGGPRG